MFVPFEKMTSNARVWVYQANEELNAAQVIIIEQESQKFIEQWTAHKQTLKGSCKVFYNRFVVIAVDESFNQVSGCSIDASVHFLQALETALQIKLFDRTQQAFWTTDKKLNTLSIKNIKQQIAEGTIQADTLVFNNLVDNMAELQSNWQKEAKNSWLGRYFD